ncbi:unnamed protein product [Ceutorhynchus assimilis]|uniref:Uncharacterized protein n=1 Tax=Ceutorhynchus assimilis TaxID=467358 RepID=A0A9N9MNS1_9CUCU|nr:unnamed protein product [Ceutorhynchus assimilis]
MNPSADEFFQTPKLVKSTGLTTSTVVKEKKKLEFLEPYPVVNQDTSLGILSLSNVNISNIFNQTATKKLNADDMLKQQRHLANNTLDRASRVSLQQGNFLLASSNSESTISESDVLLQTPRSNGKLSGDLVPQNTSTPRSSDVAASTTGRESIFSKFIDMLDTDMSTHNAFEEFKQIVEANKNDSSLFIPAEQSAAKLLLADELSYNRKQLPIEENFTSFQSSKDIPSMSMSEFFMKGSDLPELQAKNPPIAVPEPLVETTAFSTTLPSNKSLSISTIQHLIAAESPNKFMDYIAKPHKQTNDFRESSDIFSLPVSQNTSYTSSYSDNEAIEVAATQHENKENREPPNTKRQIETPTPKPPSPGPSRSSSSLTCLPNGKLPLESTVAEIVWGCVKPNKCNTKKFMLRNRSPKTLRIQCSVSTQEFKIRKDNSDNSDHLSTCKLVLYGHESRPLVISFVPTKMGPALDELCFAPLDSNLTQTRKQCVRLWGYGGYMNIEYLNTSRDSTGKYWLSLGKMDNRVLVEQSFIVKNTGNLTSFTYIKVIPKNLVTFSNVKIEPNIFVLLPNQEKTVTVTYIPNAKDCQFLKQNRNVFVMDIGKLEIVSGPEVNRARLRRLCRKSIEKGLKVDTLTKTLSEKIPAESITNDILKFKESPNAIPDLLETFTNGEIVLTIEQDPNQTLVAEYPEDSIIYQTLCESQDETVLQVVPKSCRLEPTALVLFPPSKSEDLLFLISDSPNTLYYEVNSNPKGLHVTPTDGALAPGGTAELKIKLLKEAKESAFMILVYVENEVFEAEVKVLLNGGRSKGHFLE